ncbi:hypothetical protein [Roseateles depolymerans]|uniref:hypothetical protein n=1 Tax=Roseateles depolymerans TaxID=76731 RepID=UPI0011C067EC|nr:hypothetical protein [Roseateles depolymerans]
MPKRHIDLQHPAQGRKTFQYDIFGDARKLTNELDKVTLHHFDAMGRLMKVQRLGVSRAPNFRDANAVGSVLTEDRWDALGHVHNPVRGHEPL